MPKTALSSPGIVARFLQILPGIIRSGPSGTFTVVDLLEDRAKHRGDSLFVHFEDQKRTYPDTNPRANQVAHWALGRGLGRGSTVGLLMESRPEYLAIWLGLAKVGAVTALLNTHLRRAALAHCLDAAGCNQLVLGTECLEAWNSLGDDRSGIDVFLVRGPDDESPAALPDARWREAEDRTGRHRKPASRSTARRRPALL